MKEQEKVLVQQNQTNSKTAKAKLDAALGISPDHSIDDFLNSLTVENDSAKNAVEKIDDTVKKEVESIDKEIHSIASFGDEDHNKKVMSMIAIDTSLKNIDELISISKEVIKHIYENIVCTELVDSELIHAAATFIESCHLNIKEYIDLYKDRLKFFDKVQFEMLQQKHKMELLHEKYKLEAEKQGANATDVTPTGMVEFDVTKIINDLKNQNI